MKPSFFVPQIGALVCVALVSACSGGGSDSAAPAPASGSESQSQKSHWLVNDVSYSSSARSTSTSESSEMTIVGAGTDGADQANGNYAGSSLLIAHSLTSPGEYRIADSFTSFTAALKANPNDRVAHITVTVGTAVLPVAATRYESAGSGTLSVTIDENGSYHFTSNQPIAINKISDLGIGVPDAPAVAQISLNGIHDFE